MVKIIIICYALTVCYKVINLQSRPFPVNKFCAQKDLTKLDRKKNAKNLPFGQNLSCDLSTGRIFRITNDYLNI